MHLPDTVNHMLPSGSTHNEAHAEGHPALLMESLQTMVLGQECLASRACHPVHSETQAPECVQSWSSFPLGSSCSTTEKGMVAGVTACRTAAETQALRVRGWIDVRQECTCQTSPVHPRYSTICAPAACSCSSSKSLFGVNIPTSRVGTGWHFS